ncbi:hypothetical protein B0A48_12908 [Cryoendolithus antarcticus]|uniref:Major facilitator superfamily (MFS) profile domain-containing protein n=1 Tax=Cryoendolithus antarcticus TaxID=1507870 RepID=A0A1V8SQB8_9PEZI|nr:hypothetical protein B0A48_12908 [Cryoendolithus antarcticus]
MTSTPANPDFKHEAEDKTSPSISNASLPVDEDATTASPSTPPSSTVLTRFFALYSRLTYTPPHVRWDPSSPPKFSIWLNVLFGFAGAFTVANLYYNHPILNILARDFGVNYEDVSIIPTLAQAGYAVGLLLLLCRAYTPEEAESVWDEMLIFAHSIGLALTSSLSVFSGLTFIVGFMTVTPQLMLPLVGDLAPPHRRAAALSIVVSGLMLGILIARLLSGIMTQYTTWRAVYWLSVALQYSIWFLLYLFMPDYPSTNPGGLNYLKMLWSILVMLTKHPILVQACAISFFTSLTFTNFWTVLTFLLSGEPYNYTPVVIGLFALIGILSMLVAPFYARYVIDRFVPLFSVILGMVWCGIGIALGTYTGTFTVAGPVIQAFMGDFGLQTAQIANRSAIYAVEPKGRNRVNTAFMLAVFCGQLTGTSVGSHLYARGGWIASGSFSMGSIGVALLLCLVRGPWEDGWIGWSGGWSVLKKDRRSGDGKAMVEERNPLRRLNTNERAAAAKEAAGDVEKGRIVDAKDDQAAVNAEPIEAGLVLRAAEDTTAEVTGEDEKMGSPEVKAVT